jgi:hypothetical protein
MSHRTLLTSIGTLVNHHHHPADLSQAQKVSLQAAALNNPAYPNIQPVHYIHLDGTDEELMPTNRYNCWGFTFNPRQCAINTGTDVQTILNDNGTQVFPPNLRIGDVICYRKNGIITHTGRILTLGPAGEPALVQSKWGDLGEYFHAPDIVPSIYGTDRTYWRVIPLTGKGDAWVKDNNSDDRLPCTYGTLCMSPDLWLNNSGGTFMEEAVGGQPNNIYVRVHNPDTLPIIGAEIRVYWCDPTTGMPHNQWNLIGTTLVDVAAGGEQISNPIIWTPNASVPDHACLFAVINTGDDPFAAATLDPITWPFDWAFDNNIVWHNLNVIWANQGIKKLSFHFTARNPFRWKLPIKINAVIEPIGPKEILMLNLNPKIAHHIIEPVRKIPAKEHLKITVLTKREKWRQTGEFAPFKKWSLASPAVTYGDGKRLSFNLALPNSARPGTAYRIYFEQHTGGRLTGAITFIVVVKKAQKIGRKRFTKGKGINKKERRRF